MKVKFPITITTPGVTSTRDTLFEGKVTETTPDSSEAFIATVDSADIAALFPAVSGAVATHLTASQLRAEYSDLELLAALQSPKV